MDPKKNWIVILEPSPFRRDETTVVGPFGRLKAWWVAWCYVNNHPFALTRRFRANEHTKIMQGKKILWPPQNDSRDD